MASPEIRGEMERILTNYAESVGINVGNDEVKALTWLGLQNTEAFKKEFDTEEKLENWSSIIRSFESVKMLEEFEIIFDSKESQTEEEDK